MSLSPKNAALTVTSLHRSGNVQNALHNVLSPHTVLRARVSNADDFVVDFTSAQYGWRECLARFVEYQAARCARLEPDRPLQIGTANHPSRPAWSPLARFIGKVKDEIATAMQKSIMGFMESKGHVGSGSYSGAVKKMLGTDKAEFEASSEEIVRLAESAMAEVINGYRSQGLFKLCLTSRGFLCCTDTPHWAEVYRKLWLTEEEYDANPKDVRGAKKAMYLWYQKLMAMGGPKLLKP